MELKPGTQLERYVLEELVGEGAQGMVFFARQLNAVDGTPVVVKVAKTSALDDAARDRFLEEARNGKKLGAHPNLAAVTDVVVHEGVPFFVMEYAPGVTLEDILEFHRKRGEPLMWDALYTILVHMASAIHWAHYGRKINQRPLGLIHRDIKPANVLVTSMGYAKLLDFGISIFREDDKTGIHLRGTPRYMSPEHVYLEPCPEMDMFSLGVIAWEMVQGRVFREGLSADMVARANCHQPPPPITNPDAPQKLVELIMSCLDEDRTERPTASDFIRALGKCPGYQISTLSVQALVTKVLGHDGRSRETKFEIEVPELLRSDDEPTAEVPVAGAAAGGEEGETVAWVRGALDEGVAEVREPEPDAPRQRMRRYKSPVTEVVAPSVSPTVVLRDWSVREEDVRATHVFPIPFDRVPTVVVGESLGAPEIRQTAVDGPVLELSGEEPEPPRRWWLLLLFIAGVLISFGLVGAVAVHLLGGG